VTDKQTDRQTDGQTDGQTEFSSLDRVCITCSALKTKQFTEQCDIYHGGIQDRMHA